MGSGRRRPRTAGAKELQPGRRRDGRYFHRNGNPQALPPPDPVAPVTTVLLRELVRVMKIEAISLVGTLRARGRVMPIRRFRSVEEMNQPVWRKPGELYQAIKATWDFGLRTQKRRFQPGVRRYRSIEEMSSSVKDD